MKITPIQTIKAPEAIGPYSQGISIGNLVFVSGQIGLVPGTGELVGPDLASQARQALKNMSEIVHATGCQLEDVVSVDVFLTDINEFQEFNQIYSEFFTSHKPARAVVAVSALPKSALVEIKCIAYRK